jgi:hypothetical protein
LYVSSTPTWDAAIDKVTQHDQLEYRVFCAVNAGTVDSVAAANSIGLDLVLK